jgi:hypothetical protein
VAKKQSEVAIARKTANGFMIRIAEGIAGWASFAQAANLSAMYSEYLTYLPIFEIAKARVSKGVRWKVLPQKKLKKSKSGRGRFRTVDFVCRSEDQKIGVVLEVKYARYNTRHCLQVTKDVRKLYDVGSEDISERTPPQHVFKYILIVGRKRNILDRVQSTAKPFSELNISNLTYFEDVRLWQQVKSAFQRPGEREPSSVDRAWAFPGIGADGLRYWTILLGQLDWWNALGNISVDTAPAEDEVNDEGAETLDDIPEAEAED